MRKPFYVEKRQTWYVWLNGKQENLGKGTEEEAWTAYEELRKASEQGDIRLSTPAVVLFDEFLSYVEKRRGARTLEWYKRYLQPFSEHIGKSLTVSKIRPFHVTKWVEKDHSESSPNTIHGAIRACQRPFNWAVKEGYLSKNPLGTMEKPTPVPREVLITPDQWEKMLKLATDEAELDLLTVIRETGCRVQEIRLVEAKHFDGERWILPPSEAKGKKRNRVIYLTERALEIIKRRNEKYPDGPIFRNSKGKPWTRNAIKCRFRKFKKLGLNLCATVIRHVYTTEALQNGVNPIALAELLGHSDITTLSRNYSHLFKSQDFLKEQAKKAVRK